MKRHRLLDDADFAEYWVEHRRRFQPRGARLLRAELAQRGVARDVAEVATSSSETSAADDAYRAAAKRAEHLRNLEPEVFEARLGAFLARRGFDWETINTTIQKLLAS